MTLALLLALGATGDAPLRVASKAFTESVLLGEVAAQAAAAAGAPVVHRRALGGTRLVWDALLAGEVDLYPEYTGTLAEEVLVAERPAAGAGQGWLEARLAARGLGWVGPLGFANNYALAAAAPVARRLGLRRVSDLAAHPELRFGLSSELMDRRDGWPGLRARYGLAPAAVRALDHDLAYRGVATGALDVIDVYTTDAEIDALGLQVLEDDRGYFPRYEAGYVYRRDAEARRPATFAALRRLVGRVDARTMRAMNADVKLRRRPEEAVAAALLGVPRASAPGRAARIAARTLEHLRLVALSLLAAIAVAVPLGVLAARRPRAGQVLLGAVGVVQTIPSLALLVFMIPALGIGTAPALVALFLYGLLPIVRNTVAGLLDVPPSVRESAEALGLAPGAILRLVELPLASRAILAGIKSAAVINVGTATLGALVGAGGLGEPIFTGIRLDDVGLILEGAIPASLLALAVQGAFDAAERVLVPAGLRAAR